MAETGPGLSTTRHVADFTETGQTRTRDVPAMIHWPNFRTRSRKARTMPLFRCDPHPDSPANINIWFCDRCNRFDMVRGLFVCNGHNIHREIGPQPDGVPKKLPCPGNPVNQDVCPGSHPDFPQHYWPTGLACVTCDGWPTGRTPTPSMTTGVSSNAGLARRRSNYESGKHRQAAF